VRLALAPFRSPRSVLRLGRPQRDVLLTLLSARLAAHLEHCKKMQRLDLCNRLIFRAPVRPVDSEVSAFAVSPWLPFDRSLWRTRDAEPSLPMIRPSTVAHLTQCIRLRSSRSRYLVSSEIRYGTAGGWRFRPSHATERTTSGVPCHATDIPVSRNIGSAKNRSRPPSVKRSDLTRSWNTFHRQDRPYAFPHLVCASALLHPNTLSRGRS